MREELVRALGSLNFIELCSANAAEAHLHKHLSCLQLLRESHLANDEWLSAAFEDCRLELVLLHVSPLLEVDELVVAVIPELIEEPDPFILVEKRLSRECPTFKVEHL
ncbi:MAG: hypothetical protein JW384_02979 [Nitrosomonadaceae bacterium]|nr:hypothetical protein [Nitrosomonadaceae bacterium]